MGARRAKSGQRDQHHGAKVPAVNESSLGAGEEPLLGSFPAQGASVHGLAAHMRAGWLLAASPSFGRCRRSRTRRAPRRRIAGTCRSSCTSCRSPSCSSTPRQGLPERPATSRPKTPWSRGRHRASIGCSRAGRGSGWVPSAGPGAHGCHARVGRVPLDLEQPDLEQEDAADGGSSLERRRFEKRRDRDQAPRSATSRSRRTRSPSTPRSCGGTARRRPGNHACSTMARSCPGDLQLTEDITV